MRFTKLNKRPLSIKSPPPQKYLKKKKKLPGGLDRGFTVILIIA